MSERSDAKAAEAQLQKAREAWAKDPSKANGRALLAARRAASKALDALWEKYPEEKPPDQVI